MTGHISSSEADRSRPGIVLRAPTVDDGAALWALARDVGLDRNSPYAYVMWADHFAGTSVVARRDGGAGDGVDGPVVGFVLGFAVPERPDATFVWQVGVADGARGGGVAGRMLDALLARTGARWLEATVTPGNAASAALFAGTARRHGVGLAVADAYPASLFPIVHEPEARFRLGPFDRTTDHARNPRT